MNRSESKANAEDHILLGRALGVLSGGPRSGLALSHLLSCDNSRLFRILSHCGKVRQCDTERALATWELIP